MMSAKARHLLCAPHMELFALHPSAALLSDTQIEALEPFARWFDTDGPDEIELADCEGFARLHDYGSAKLGDLAEALGVFGDGSIVGLMRVAARRLKNAETFRGITKGRSRDYRRKVSVPVSELPKEWQDALSDMEAGVERGIRAPLP